MSLIRYPIKDIKKEINSDNKVFWFLMGPKKGTVVAKGSNKTDAGENLRSVIDKKRDKFIGRDLWRVSLSTHDEKKESKTDPIYGDVRAMLENYRVKEGKDKIKVAKVVVSGASGPVWFARDWLEWNNWKKDYIRNIVDTALKKKHMKITGHNFYRVYFE